MVVHPLSQGRARLDGLLSLEVVLSSSLRGIPPSSGPSEVTSIVVTAEDDVVIAGATVFDIVKPVVWECPPGKGMRD